MTNSAAVTNHPAIFGPDGLPINTEPKTPCSAIDDCGGLAISSGRPTDARLLSIFGGISAGGLRVSLPRQDS